MPSSSQGVRPPLHPSIQSESPLSFSSFLPEICVPCTQDDEDDCYNFDSASAINDSSGGNQLSKEQNRAAENRKPSEDDHFARSQNPVYSMHELDRIAMVTKAGEVPVISPSAAFQKFQATNVYNKKTSGESNLYRLLMILRFFARISPLTLPPPTLPLPGGSRFPKNSTKARTSLMCGPSPSLLRTRYRGEPSP